MAFGFETRKTRTDIGASEDNHGLKSTVVNRTILCFKNACTGPFGACSYFIQFLASEVFLKNVTYIAITIKIININDRDDKTLHVRNFQGLHIYRYAQPLAHVRRSANGGSCNIHVTSQNQWQTAYHKRSLATN